MKLPKTLFARIEQDGDETYVIADEYLDDAIAEQGVTKVGTYKLESVERYERVSRVVKG